ncbi:radical SAM protein [candidate division WOR-3 bacterium]|nr:radical SAM protein [candidate division WOR-3 bacterium]
MLFKKTAKQIQKGLYHKRGESGRYQGYRLHLRVKEDGTGILVINASRILHLNKTGTEFAKYIIEEKGDKEAVKEICSRYRVRRQDAEKDYLDLKKKILKIAESERIEPEIFLKINRIDAFSVPLTAPYRSDIVLTYRCNNNCEHCYVGRKKPFPEMETEDWKKVIKKLWKIGIPHITFTGGEPTLREDLPDLIAYAEDIGLVTGVITNGRLLSKELVRNLVNAGLDHIQITIESYNAETHNKMVQADAWKETVAGIKNSLDSPLYVLTNTTLTTDNSNEIEEHIKFLKNTGLEKFAYNSIIYSGNGRSVGTGIEEEKIGSYVNRIKKKAEEVELDFIWYTPTHYCVFDPCIAGVGLKQCSAAKYNIAVEPNGDVIPCQSYFETMGNILNDPWDMIWNSDVALYLRNNEYVEEKCKVCPDLNLCGNGCPLYNKAKDTTVLCSKG